MRLSFHVICRRVSSAETEKKVAESPFFFFLMTLLVDAHPECNYEGVVVKIILEIRAIKLLSYPKGKT